MALLQSEKMPLGKRAADFSLQSVDGRMYSLKSFAGKKAVVVMFICNHCPYVKAIEDRLLTLNREFSNQGVQLVGICSNDPTDYPDDSPENLRKRWQEKQYGFPYLIDETQDVARRYGAVCTPDLFVLDANLHLVYHGQLDDNWKEADKVKRRDLAEALKQILAGQPVSAQQTPSMGCSIKWKKEK